MTQKSEVGQIGENIACYYLVKNDYKIIDRNYRQKWGELDIITKDPDGTLVFVEVKTMRQSNAAIAELTPEDNLTAAKLKKLQRTAQLFAGFREDLIDEKTGWRIDLIAISLSGASGVKQTVKHYKNI